MLCSLSVAWSNLESIHKPVSDVVTSLSTCLLFSNYFTFLLDVHVFIYYFCFLLLLLFYVWLSFGLLVCVVWMNKFKRVFLLKMTDKMFYILCNRSFCTKVHPKAETVPREIMQIYSNLKNIRVFSYAS